MPRKSDTARRSNGSMATFAVQDGDVASEKPVLAPAPAADTSTQLDSTPTTAPGAENSEMDVVERASGSAAPSEKKDRDTVAVEDLNLPKSIITRLAKGVLPPNTQIQANAILAMTKAATVFINHLANAANERTMGSNKKTIMPADVFDALDDIEYPEFKDLVQLEFKKFNEIQSSKRNTYRRKVAAAKKGVPYVETSGLLREPRVPDATGPPGTTFIEDPAAAAGIDTSRSIKKQRLSTANANGGTNPDDSAMTGVDADETQEYQDAESEPDEDIEEDEEDADEVEDEEDEEEEVAEEDEMHDALEEREDQNEEDEALDNGEDSDS